MKIKFLTILLISLVSCKTIEEKSFESTYGWFTLKYPEHWDQFEEEDGTYLFMDNDDWKGNLRITAMGFASDNNEDQTYKIKKGLQDELNKFEGAKLIRMGDNEAVYYLKEIEQDGEKLLMYNWTIGHNATLLLCSFVIDAERSDEEAVRRELQFAIRTLESIHIR